MLLGISLLFFCSIFSCGQEPSTNSTALHAVEGVLDLSQVKFDGDTIVQLTGDFEWYWNQALYPKDFIDQVKIRSKTFASLPEFWSSSGQLSPYGYGTYRLTIKLPETSTKNAVYGLKTSEVLTATRLYIDGKLADATGTFSQNESDGKPGYAPDVVYFSADSNQIELVLQVSNYHYIKAGVWQSYSFGSSTAISKMRHFSIQLDLFLTGCLAIMFIYHLGLYLLRPKDSSALWFALFCIVVFLRIMVTGDNLAAQWIPGFDWELARKLEFLPLNIGSLFFVLFMRSLFRDETHPLMFRLYVIAACIFGAIVVMLPARYSGTMIGVMQVLVCIGSLWVLSIIIRAILHKREGARQILLGFSVLFLTVANDILYANMMIKSAYIMPIGFFIFILFQAFILAAKFSSSFKSAESLSIQLRDTNTSLRRFVPSEFLDFLNKSSILDVRLGDQVQKEMAILFSDIRSFTSMSEKMSPTENFNFLNSYLKRVGPVIRKHHGFIDKYIGDGFMALFPKSIDHAVAAAVEIQEKVVVYNQHRKNSNYSAVKIGIGVHSGHLMLGTIGEEDRMDTTVISDTVNLASRMEGLTKVYGNGVIMPEALVLQLQNPNHYNWRRLDIVRVRGRTEPMALVQIFDGLADFEFAQLKQLRPSWEEAVSLYRRGEMHQALAIFRSIKDHVPNDPATELFIVRTSTYAKNGLPEGWDGIEDWNN